MSSLPLGRLQVNRGLDHPKALLKCVGQGDIVNEYETNTYLVNLYLPNRVVVTGARVAEGSVSGAEILIGMDVIGAGDFAVTHHEGRTTWIFRVPSCEEIDFVKEYEDHNKLYASVLKPPLTEEGRRKARNKRKAERRKRNR